MEMNWNRLLCLERPGKTEYSADDGGMRSEFEKDYHRIIVSASFRRLQDKTQVFPLDKSDFIRTRLTHSLEVSSIARSLGQSVASAIIRRGLDPEFDGQMKADLCDVLQCAGLIHDIGNPPFGHFGEETIRAWFQNALPKLVFRGRNVIDLLKPQQIRDLMEFEGNAQGLRMISKLDYPVHHDGLNLTYAVMSAMMKYPTASDQDAMPSYCHGKFGYYFSERELFKELQNITGTEGRRNPLAFLLEAADDIAYATADIEDAFKKGFFDFSTLCFELRDRGTAKEYRVRLEDLYDLARLSGAAEPEESAVRSWLREMQDELIAGAAGNFADAYSPLMAGTWEKELLSGKKTGVLLQVLKNIAYDYAFTSMSIYKSEIAAGRILNTLMDFLVPASLALDEEKQGLMDEKYLSLIPENYRLVCRKASEGSDDGDRVYARIRMAVDTVSGMTDSYAKDLYSELTGLT